MVVPDNAYSRVIAWLKILLPLLALGVLSTLFLVARTVDPAQNLPFAEVDVEGIAREQRIGGPQFSSVTDDGSAISLSAKSARPDPENTERVSGTGVNAGIDLPGGGRIDVVATEMELDNRTGSATLSDGVTITTSDGYVMQTQQVQIALDATRVVSQTRTTVEAPIGSLSADSFELSKRAENDQPYVLVFKGHVKLLYVPKE